MKRKRISVRISYGQTHDGKVLIGAADRGRIHCKNRLNDEKVFLVRKSNSVDEKSVRGGVPRVDQGIRMIIKPEGIKAALGVVNPREEQEIRAIIQPERLKIALGVVNPREEQEIRVIIKPEGIKAALGVVNPREEQEIRVVIKPETLKAVLGVANLREEQEIRVVIKPETLKSARGVAKLKGNKIIRRKLHVNRKACGGGRNKPDFGE